MFKSRNNYKDVFDTLSTLKLLQYGFSEDTALRIFAKYTKLDTDFLDSLLLKNAVEIITFSDPSYPSSLKEIANPPFFLYVRGKLSDNPALAVIGARKISDYGKKVIEKFIPDLSRFFSIVSGGAFGCDSIAHKETLRSHGKTYVVIGTGIDKAYPAENRKMYDEVIELGGAIISIFPLGEPPNGYNFPIRNEIISGIVKGVVVIEAAEKSGTLITVNLALEQGRDVFAVPGDIFRTNSFGCNMLLSSGLAKISLTAQDILEEYNIVSQKNQIEIVFENDIEKRIYEMLMGDSGNIDELAKKLDINISILSGILSLLEIRGIICYTGNGKYEII